MSIFDRLLRAKPDAGTHVPPDKPIESVEGMRKRARQRLVGSAVLVAVGVSLFAVMFDRQPRPVSVDIPIDIPDKNRVKPLDLPVAPPSTSAVSAPSAASASRALPAALPAAVAVAAVATAAIATQPSTVAPDKSLATGEKIVPPSKPVTPPAAAPPPPKPGLKEPVKEPVKEPAKPTPAQPPTDRTAIADSIRAKALLEGASPQAAKEKATPTSAADTVGERFIVQFGSFGEAARAQEARKTVEQSGLKTYAQEATTADGKRIRVRVGPFATRAEAEKAATRIKSLGLPASILTI